MLLSLALVLGLKDSLRTICKSLALALKVQALALALALKGLGLGLGLEGLGFLGLGSAASHPVASFTCAHIVSPFFAVVPYQKIR